MSLAKASLKADTASLWPRPVALVGLLPLVGLIAFGFLTARLSAPPAPVAANAPATDFSSGRAMVHLRAIAQTARPIGSPAHAEARQYILDELAAQGIAPVVQKANVIDQDQGVPFTAATVENILGRLPGTQSGNAILLASHYDSVPTGP